MNQHRTEFASRALLVSDIFNMKFKKMKFTGSVTRVVTVDAEEKESTGGGKMARESIMLAPEQPRPGVANIVVGFIDVGQSVAELRTYNALHARHRQRFGDAPFEIKREEYDQFLSDAKSFLEAEKLKVEQVDAKPVELSKASRPASAAPQKSGGLGIGAVILIVLVALALGAGAAFFFLNQGAQP